MKFLDLENKQDEKSWEEIIEEGHGADLHRCPYDQDFKSSSVCPKYQDNDVSNGECEFLLITNSKCFCELQPRRNYENI